MHLKTYQLDAVNDIFSEIKKSLINSNKEDIILQAPTGSGKTIIAIRILDKLVSDLSYIDKCFIWLSIGHGGLHKQSLDSIEKNSEQNIYCFSDDYLKLNKKNIINSNEVIVLSWNNIVQERKKTQKALNKLMKKSERGITYVPDLIKNTKTQRKIILIIDECHHSATTIKAIKTVLKIEPDFILKMSATPININSTDTLKKVEILDCVQEEMLKKNIICNNLNKNDGDTIQINDLIIEASNKRKEIEDTFKKIGKNINPLCLIQIPNKDSDPQSIIYNTVINTLKTINVTESNKKLFIYLSEKPNMNEETAAIFKDIRNHQNPIEFLIFKQAINTGWDCNRAHILLKLRKIESEVFKIQTLGRIMRTPYQQHYNNTLLDSAYCYTNILENISEIKKFIGIECYKKIQFSQYKDKFPPLISFYRDIKKCNSTQDTYEENKKIHINKAFIKYIKKRYNLNAPTKNNINFNKIKLEEQGIKFTLKMTQSLFSEYKIDPEFLDILKEERKIDTSGANTLNLDLLPDESIQYLMEAKLQQRVPNKYVNVLKTSFYSFCQKFIGENDKRLIQKFFLANSEIFQSIITSFLKKVNIEYYQKTPQSICYWFPPPVIVSSEANINNTIQKYLYEPSAPRKDSTLENRFNSIIDSQSSVLWWFKNGVKNKKFLGIRYELDFEYGIFYPDYIVKFNNGVIGIFETKGDLTSNDTRIKAKALADYIKERRDEGIPVIGGIVREHEGIWEINNKEEYKPEIDMDWKDFQIFIHKLEKESPEIMIKFGDEEVDEIFEPVDAPVFDDKVEKELELEFCNEEEEIIELTDIVEKK